MSETPEHVLRAILSEVRDHEGRGTELVSLYVPPDKNLGSVQQRIDNEYAQAENIKSDRTRDNVQTALKKVRRVLQQYPEVPSTGLAIFAGQVSDGDVVEYVFDDLPRAVQNSNYTCDDTFDTEPLEQILSPDEAYGLIVLDRNEATIGRLVGDRVQIETHKESMVMGKTKAGGQSQARFERLREEQKENFFKDIAGNARDAFINDDGDLTVEGVLLGGTTITVDDFTNGDYLDYRIRDAILGQYGIDHGKEQGLDRLVEKGEQDLVDDSEQTARELVERFFEGLATDEPPVTYGREYVEQALDPEYGAVDTLLLSAGLNSSEMTQLSEQAENIGADVEVIPTSFDKGAALEQNFGGMAAILRFEIFFDE